MRKKTQATYRLRVQLSGIFMSVCIVWLWFSRHVAAQPPGDMEFIHLTALNQFPGDQTTCVAEDNLGFIWIGTSNGLYRYDGVNVIPFRAEAGDTSLSGKSILCLHTDRNNNLWAGTKTGLFRINLKTRALYWYSEQGKPNSVLSNNLVQCIVEARNGDIYLGTWSGLDRYNASSQTIDHLTFTHPKTDVNDYWVYSLVEDRQGNIWAGTWSGHLHVYTPAQKRYTQSYMPEAGNPKLYWGERIMALHEDTQGNIWVGTWSNGLHIFRPNSEQTEKIPLNAGGRGTNQIRCLKQDTEGRIWIGSENGLVCTNENLSWSEHYTHSDLDVWSIPNRLISGIFVDSRQRLWVSANTLSYAVLNKPIHHIYKGKRKTKGTLSSNIVRYIRSGDNNTFLITTNDGIDRFDPKTREIINFLTPRDALPVAFATHDDRMWTSRSPTPHTSYNGKPVTSLPISELRQGLEDKHGNIWATGTGGLIIYSPRNQKHVFLPLAPNNGSSATTISILAKGPGYFCTSFSNKILIIKELSTDEIPLASEAEKLVVDSVILSEPISDMLHDQGNRFWVTTQRGLATLDIKSGELHDIKLLDANYQASALKRDKNGHLWILFKTMVVRYDARSKSAYILPLNSGANHMQFSYQCLHTTPDGYIAAGSNLGFYFFHCDTLPPQPENPTMLVTDILVHGFSLNPFTKLPSENYHGAFVAKQDILYTESIELNHRKNIISFEFASCNTLNHDHIRVSYMLQGFDTVWTEAGSDNKAVFTNLPPGKYSFRVRAKSLVGEWGPVKQVIITILPPWYRRWWAVLIFTLCFAGILLFLRHLYQVRQNLEYSLEIERLRRENIEEVHQFKMRFFTNISHEFRTPLTLIKAPLEKLAENQTDPSQKNLINIIERNANRLLQLINQILDLRKIEAGKMDVLPTNGDLVGIAKEIVNSFSSLAAQQNLLLEFESAQEALWCQTDVDKIEKILYNLISNAIKNTPAGGKVAIQIGAANSLVLIQIQDTGIGIPAEVLPHIFDRFYQVNDQSAPVQGGTGIGLALTRELTDLLQGTIHVESKVGQGSTFTVSLPFLEIKADNQADTTLPKTQEADLPPSLPAHASFDSDKPIILVIEDNADLNQVLVSHLSKKHNVISAFDGRAGLSLALEHLPELIVTDIFMPQMDGMELCRELKTKEETNHIPILMLTARTAEDLRLQSYEYGADAFISKPFGFELLDVRIKNLLENRRLLASKLRNNPAKDPRELVSSAKPEGRFIEKAIEIIEKHLDNPELNAEMLASEIGMSRAQLYRKFHTIAGQTTNEFIKSTRLRKAADMIVARQHTISEIATMTGFSDTSRFSRLFKEFYGIQPSRFEGEEKDSI